MKTTDIKIPPSRIPTSEYWEDYWYRRPVGVIATLQLIMAFIILGMEIGNAEVDLFRTNVYSGFWSFLFMISAVILTYSCAYTTRTLTRTVIALVLQVISMIVMIIVVGFLITFIVENFTLCLGFQCYQSSSSSYSSSTYISLKKAFISCELGSSVIYILLSLIYIYLFVKCYNRVPRVHPIALPSHVQNALYKKQLTNLSRTARYWSMPTTSHNRMDHNDKLGILPSTTKSYTGALKVCPNCEYVSPYIPTGKIVECPSCKYQSPFVEHGQQS